MPIIIAAEYVVTPFGLNAGANFDGRREAGEIVIAENATVWEFTPFEFGSWSFGSTTKIRGAFTSLEYLGTGLNNAAPNGSCYKGFDQLR